MYRSCTQRPVATSSVYYEALTHSMPRRDPQNEMTCVAPVHLLTFSMQGTELRYVDVTITEQ